MNRKQLLNAGGVCEREPNSDEEDDDGLWYYEGITLYENGYDGSFNFATVTRENGGFKSGFKIKSLKQLNALIAALHNKL